MKSKYELGQKTKNVTILPDFVLKITGRLDAKKGSSVANAHIRCYLNKCVSIENEECLEAAEFLKNIRIEGAQTIAVISKHKKLIPEMPGVIEVKNSWDALENRKRANALYDAMASVENARARLYEVNEQLLNGAAILDERISRIRRKAGVKIDAYIKGLRAGGLTDFDPVIEYSDTAKELYYEKHHALDEAIAAGATVPNFEEVE